MTIKRKRVSKSRKVSKRKPSRFIYEFIYFDPSNPDRDKTWRSKSLKNIKIMREDIVRQTWGDDPKSVPIIVRYAKSKKIVKRIR